MCGINGILHLNNQRKINQRVLIKMGNTLEHRGPDEKALYVDNNVGLGHRRLSIIDISDAGNQSFFLDNGRYIMILNGEIFNFKDFYPELKSKGFEIKTSPDKEVLRQLFQLYGLKMLNRLNGFFAFVIWDKLEKKLTIARDRMGVNPFYYTFYDDSFYFASEQKVLFTAGIRLKISQDGLEDYIFKRFVAGDDTLCENIKKLLSGHSMTIEENGKIEIQKWWDLKAEIQNYKTIQNPAAWFKETFDDSARLIMISDVSVGIMLNGGLYSSSILATLNSQDFKKIQTFNVGFTENFHNEAHLAKLMSEKCNYDFKTTQLNNQMLFDKLVEATYFQDEPLMHLSEPHILTIAQMAKPKVKVLLFGEGANELMSGYTRYKTLQYPFLLKSLNTFSEMNYLPQKPRIEKLLRYSKIDNYDHFVVYNDSTLYQDDIAKTFGISNQPKKNYRNQILLEAKELYPYNYKRQTLYFDQHTYPSSLLDRNNRCTMGASVECREPFLDSRLIIGLVTLEDKWLFTGKKGKYVQNMAMQDRLPKEILNFKKNGSSATWGDYIIKNPAFKDEMTSFAGKDLFKMSFFENIKINK